jgi:hypothetical protein
MQTAVTLQNEHGYSTIIKNLRLFNKAPNAQWQTVLFFINQVGLEEICE